MMCYCCGREKDPNRGEVYPYPGDRVFDDRLIPPIIRIHALLGETKVANVCHECFHRIQPDMWVDAERWDALVPVVAFDDLPERKAIQWQG